MDRDRLASHSQARPRGSSRAEALLEAGVVTGIEFGNVRRDTTEEKARES